MSVIHFGPEGPPSHPEFSIDEEIRVRQERFTNNSARSGSTVHSIFSWSSRGSRKSTLSTHHAPGQRERSKTDFIREIIRKWRRSLLKQHDERDPSRPAAPIEQTTSPAAIQQTPDYASLIKAAISNSPSCALCADEICKELIRTNEWCRTNQDPGWQETVALELPRNPAFEAFIETHRQRISNGGQVKWKLAVACSGASTGELSWRPPRHSPSHPIELPTEKVLDSAGAARETGIPPADVQHTDSPLLPSLHGSQKSTTFLGLNGHPAKNGGLEILDQTSAARYKNKCHTTCNGTGSMNHSASLVETLGNSNLSQGSSPTSQGGFEPPRRTQPGGAGDGNGGRKRPRLDVSDSTLNKPKLACVYRKMDPQTYDLHSRDYQACVLKGWENPADLLLHLQRKHGQYSCRRCYQYFGTPEERIAHSRQCSRHLPATREQKWGKLWRLRFPDIPVPEDPYFDPAYGVPRLMTIPETGVSRPDGDLLPSSPQPSLPVITFSNPPQDAQMLSPNADLADSQPTTPSEAMQGMESRIQFLEQQLPLIERNFELLKEYVMRSFDSIPDHASPRQDPAGKLAASFGGTIYGPSDRDMLTVPFDDSGSLSTLAPSTAPSMCCHVYPTTPSSKVHYNSEISGVPLSAAELHSSLMDGIDANYLDREPDADSPMPDMDHEAYLYNLGPLAGSTPGFAFN
ncbi:hypothetical protein BJY00DRAFT_294749 [Aspergillus carlsbadensis]|nr:hypothetical protein BJY00DRAFT_294749 [Aspergillus carlsbadensis]